MKICTASTLAALVCWASSGSIRAQDDTGDRVIRPLRTEQVEQFARLVIKGIHREYPNKPSNVMAGPESVRSPRDLHPVFYGCFDWHSSVHGHWVLVRLLKLHPRTAVDGEMRQLLNAQFDQSKLATEAAYFLEKENRSFERMYGWAWALRLAAELRSWDDPDGRRWAAAFSVLEKTIVDRAQQYLPLLEWPIRTGVHPDTAFALAQILDYARATGNGELAELVVERAAHYYGADTDYPVRYEPSGEDFFSAGLNEADLMRRVFPAAEYAEWLTRFFPGLDDGSLGNLLTPAEVRDVTDGKLVHLAGLNFARAWTMRGIAHALAPTDPRRQTLEVAADAHARAGLAYVFSGHYEGEHWLATFAVYVLTDVGLDEPK